jgi:hypothetical protein
VVEGNLITGVHVSPQAIVTISRSASVKWWQRPKRQGKGYSKGKGGGGMVRAETRREIASAA